MSALAGTLSNAVGQGVGLSKSAGLLQELTGQAGRVQIVQPGYGCVLQFDACINEQHGREAQVTTNPIEDGGVISDHIIVQPLGLSLTGVVSDTPLYDAQRFLTQTIGNAASTLLSPLGIVAAATAYQLTHPQDSVTSPSHEAYRTLMRLAAGDPQASPPSLPQPFNVLTAYLRYTDMIITSLQMPRDAGTNGQCVFTIVMTQIVRVTPQAINVSVVENKLLGANKKVKGEQELAAEAISAQVQAGAAAGQAAETSIANVAQKALSYVGLGG